MDRLVGAFDFSGFELPCDQDQGPVKRAWDEAVINAAMSAA